MDVLQLRKLAGAFKDHKMIIIILLLEYPSLLWHSDAQRESRLASSSFHCRTVEVKQLQKPPKVFYRSIFFVQV